MPGTALADESNTSKGCTSFAVCTDGSHSCQCGSGLKAITTLQAPCKVTSDTGSCNANKKNGNFYACCVCVPK